LTGEYETAKDLAQDTFIQAFQSLRKNKNRLLKAWALTGLLPIKHWNIGGGKKYHLYPVYDYLKADPLMNIIR